MDSCLVMTETSPGFTLLKKPETDTGPEGRPVETETEAASLTCTGNIPEPLSFWRAARALSASTMPFMLLPEVSRAVYS
jgi:hypothetical protein